MNNMDTEHRFTARIERSGDMDAAYVVVPVDIRAVYGVGRLKVEATFDGEPYSGSVVNTCAECTYEKDYGRSVRMVKDFSQ